MSKENRSHYGAKRDRYIKILKPVFLPDAPVLAQIAELEVKIAGLRSTSIPVRARTKRPRE